MPRVTVVHQLISPIWGNVTMDQDYLPVTVVICAYTLERWDTIRSSLKWVTP